MLTTRDAAAACYPHDVPALVRALDALPAPARDAFVAAIDSGDGWDAAAAKASLAAPGVAVVSPFGERVNGALTEEAEGWYCPWTPVGGTAAECRHDDCPLHGPEVRTRGLAGGAS